MEKIIIIVAILLVTSFLIKRFKARAKGTVGEKTVSFLLRGLDPEKYRLHNNIILDSSGSNKSTQIDHVVVSVYGLFVIETKNYKGQIYGSEHARQWTQNIYGKKYQFMNPIHQNYGHVKALENLLNDNGYKDIPIISIITFPGDCTLNVSASKAYVVKWGAVSDIIKDNAETLVLSRDAISNISKLLEGYKATFEKTAEHVNALDVEKEDCARKVDAGICPKCGNELVLRNGKYGSFYGCKGYPKCRYTSNIK